MHVPLRLSPSYSTLLLQPAAPYSFLHTRSLTSICKLHILLPVTSISLQVAHAGTPSFQRTSASDPAPRLLEAKYCDISACRPSSCSSHNPRPVETLPPDRTHHWSYASLPYKGKAEHQSSAVITCFTPLLQTLPSSFFFLEHLLCHRLRLLLIRVVFRPALIPSILFLSL